MNDYGISDKSWSILIDVIASFKNIQRVLIFGSRAKGNYKKGSDIDLAIEGVGVDVRLSLDLSSKLNEESNTPYYFDVVAVDSLENKELFSHIKRVGKEIYRRDL